MSRALLLFLIAAFAYEAQAQPQRLVKAPSPQPATIAGYVRGHCVASLNQVRICKMLSESDDTFLVEKDGKRVGSWAGSSYLGETEDFEVLLGDLDGDKRSELIVANRDSSSAGMGVSYWTIAIFPDTEFRNYQPPLTFRVQEYGTFGTFVSAGRTINILTTRWESTTDPKGRRGEGLYLVGQWWRYKSGELLPMLNRGTIGRRYLLSFERERWNTIDSDRKPYSWLSHVNAEPLKGDLLGPGSGSKRGVIEASLDPHQRVRIVFRADNEQPTDFVYPHDDDVEGGNELRYIGDAASGRLYPSHYLPARPEAWLNGKRAILRTYGDDRRFHVLWLEPATKKPKMNK